MTFAQLAYLRRELHGSIEGRATRLAAGKVIAASALLGATAYGVWWVIEGAVGEDGVLARAIAVLPALAAGALVYALAVQALHVPEAQQIRELVTRRLRRA